MKRRDFIRSYGSFGMLGLTGAASLLTACKAASDSDPEPCQGRSEEPVLNWKMVTTWPRDFPALGTGANRLAEYITRLSNGRLNVKVYGGNELVPPFEVFDAVSRGTAQLGHGAPYYWKGKIPAAQFFAGVPFGFTAQEQNAWLYHGGGLNLWRKAYADFNLRPFPAGNTGVQMGGWYNKEISQVDDLKGLKMRIPGLGGEVLKRAGGTPLNIPGAELFTALQTGTIDATEWVGPYNDLAFGLFRAAQYYYYPGWHEPGTTLETMVNLEAWQALPDDLQAVVEIACQAANIDMLAEFTARNGEALRQLIEEHKVEVRTFPKEVIGTLKRLTSEVLAEVAESDLVAGEVFASYQQFMRQVRPWSDISERSYANS